jgi:DNA-binding NarL/FixJ family response regulator
VYFLTNVRLFAEGLSQILDLQPTIQVTGATASAREAISTVIATPPDVVLIDLQPPEGPQIVQMLQAAAPQTSVVALAVPEAETEVIAWAEAGVAGFLPREGSLEELIAMIHSVARGETICSPHVAATLFRRVAALAGSSRHGPLQSPTVHLTTREMEIVRLIDRGMSNQEIARSLHIALPTVKNHIHHLLEKLQVHRRSEAASAVLDPRRRIWDMDLRY